MKEKNSKDRRRKFGAYDVSLDILGHRWGR